MGSYPALSLAHARAQLLLHDVEHEAAKKGEADHPAIAARQARIAAKALPTVTEVFEEWLADKRMGSSRKGGAPVRERTITVVKNNFDLDIRGRIGEVKIGRLTRNAAQACIDGPRKRNAPGAAAHVYRTLRGLVTFAIKRDYIEGPDPMRDIDNPRPYQPGPVNAANDAELVALFKTLDSSATWPATKLAIEFQLLTGVRPGEARLASWEGIAFEKETWTIPAERVKSGREFLVHLSHAALAMLDRARSLGGLNASGDRRQNDFVFPGATGGHLEKMAVARALARIAERVADSGGKKLRPNFA
jgi:integrase